jgi:hypothetical protein
LKLADHPCAISGRRTVSWAIFSTGLTSMAAKGRPATAKIAAHRLPGSFSPDDPLSTAVNVKDSLKHLQAMVFTDACAQQKRAF